MSAQHYPRFHLALPVTDLQNTPNFYTEVLGCERGRSSDRWIDLNFWGHQLVLHLVGELAGIVTNPVDGEQVPAAHFGPVLPWDEFEPLVERLRVAEGAVVLEPTCRFQGRRGEQKTLFVRDPSGNHIEFKAFRNIDMLFATDGLDYP